MTNEELYLAVALNGWKGNLERADKMFSGLSDQEVLNEIAPGKNRLIYLWGHLTATHDRHPAESYQSFSLSPGADSSATEIADS